MYFCIVTSDTILQQRNLAFLHIEWNVVIVSPGADCQSVNLSGHVYSSFATTADQLAAASVQR